MATTALSLQERRLYHQIHPVKLAVDWSTGMACLPLLWIHHLAVSLVVMFGPSLIASIILITWTDLGRYQASRFGGYVRRTMTRIVEATRFAGYFAMAVGAWFHIAWLLPLGLVVIVAAWLSGLVHRPSGADPR